MNQEREILQRRIENLLDRLERLSADSAWAHKASGLRGSLIRAMAEMGGIEFSGAYENISQLVAMGEDILVRAAKEIPERN